MKNTISVIIAGVFCIIPPTLFYFIWSFLMAAVPANEWQSLIQIILSIFLFVLGFGSFFWAMVIAMAVGISFANIFWRK
jgi:hypothetical protein